MSRRLRTDFSLLLIFALFFLLLMVAGLFLLISLFLLGPFASIDLRVSQVPFGELPTLP